MLNRGTKTLEPSRSLLTFEVRLLLRGKPTATATNGDCDSDGDCNCNGGRRPATATGVSMSRVDSESGEGYRPQAEYEEDGNGALVDLNLTDSTELWLLKLPFSNDLLSDIDGQELSLKLHSDGKLASFEGSSGKVYDFVSFASQEPDETVFVSSSTEPKIAGKISRRVSVVHYPDPKELEKLSSTTTRQARQNSAGVTVTTSSRYFPMQSGKSSQSGRAASSKGSRQKSSISEVTDPSNSAKRRPMSSYGRHVPEFSQGHSSGISPMSSDGGKSKRRKHKE